MCDQNKAMDKRHRGRDYHLITSEKKKQDGFIQLELGVRRCDAATLRADEQYEYSTTPTGVIGYSGINNCISTKSFKPIP